MAINISANTDFRHAPLPMFREQSASKFVVLTEKQAYYLLKLPMPVINEILSLNVINYNNLIRNNRLWEELIKRDFGEEAVPYQAAAAQKKESVSQSDEEKEDCNQSSFFFDVYKSYQYTIDQLGTGVKSYESFSEWQPAQIPKKITSFHIACACKQKKISGDKLKERMMFYLLNEDDGMNKLEKSGDSLLTEPLLKADYYTSLARLESFNPQNQKRLIDKAKLSINCWNQTDLKNGQLILKYWAYLCLHIKNFDLALEGARKLINNDEDKVKILLKIAKGFEEQGNEAAVRSVCNDVSISIAELAHARTQTQLELLQEQLGYSSENPD